MDFKKFYISEGDKPDYWFKFATPEEVVDIVKKKYSVIPIDNFKYIDEPDDFIDTYDASKLRGFFGEYRQYWFNKEEKTGMFGNYTMKDWYNFLVSIATKGLEEPVLLSPDGKEIIEGNHRVQALYQLGYKKIPVVYERK